MRSLLLIISLLVASVSAQSSDLLSILISEGLSIFTSITANLATSTPSSLVTRTSSASTRQTAASVPSSAASSISSSLSSEAASISSQLSSALASISSQSSLAQNPSNTITSNPTGTAAAASATSASANPAAGTSGSNHDRKLAIILGTVLGALALGLFILLLLLLCRRRKRRAAGARSHSLSSNSNEALTSQKTPFTHTTPAGAALASRRSRSLNRRSNNGVPVMTERSNYDVPSAHQFGGNNTAPFVPNSTGTTRTSGILPTHSNNALTGHHQPHTSTGSGLNSHPYNDNLNPVSMVAAGAGGAALGAAAARHSKSGERRSGDRYYSRNHSGESLSKGRSRSGDRIPDPVVSGAAVHPAYWEEPNPPRSPHRSSPDYARRRSGSGPRGALPGTHEHTNSPLRNNMPGVAAGGLAGLAAGTAANHAGHRGHERGRSLGANNSIYDHGTNNLTSTGPSGVPTHSGARGSNNPFNRHSGSGVPVSALVGGPTHHNQSRSRSRTHPAVPSALVIPDSQQRRSLPSRSPKRTRFAPGEHHEPMPYDDNRRSRDAISPPLPDSTRNSTYTPLAAGTRVEDPVSPISHEDTTRGFSHIIPSNARPNHIDRQRSRSPDFVHTIHLPTTTTITTMRTKPRADPTQQHPIQRPGQQRQNSGLVNAVSDHFTPSPPPTYQAYSPHDDELTRTTSKPMSRKPVAPSPYNTTTTTPPINATANNGMAAGPPQMTGNRRSEDDTWWRGQEDSAWRESYIPTGERREGGVGHAR